MLEPAWGIERITELAQASGEPLEDVAVVNLKWYARRMIAGYAHFFVKLNPGDYVTIENKVDWIYRSCVEDPVSDLTDRDFGDGKSSYSAQLHERCKETAHGFVELFTTTNVEQESAATISSTDKEYQAKTNLFEAIPASREKAYALCSTIIDNIAPTKGMDTALEMAVERITGYLYNNCFDVVVTSIMAQAMKSAVDRGIVTELPRYAHPPAAFVTGGPASWKTSLDLREFFTNSVVKAMHEDDGLQPDTDLATIFSNAATFARDNFRPFALSDITKKVPFSELHGSQYSDMTDLETKWMRKKIDALIQTRYTEGKGLPPFRVEFVPPPDEGFTLQLEYVKELIGILLDVPLAKAVIRAEDRAQYPGDEGASFREVNHRRFVSLDKILQSYKHAGNFAASLVAPVPEGNARPFWVLSSDVEPGEPPRLVSFNDKSKRTMRIFDLPRLLELSRKKRIIGEQVTPENTEEVREAILAGSPGIYEPGFQDLCDNTDDIVRLAGTLRSIDFCDENNAPYASVLNTLNPQTNKSEIILYCISKHPLAQQREFQAVVSALRRVYPAIEEHTIERSRV